MNKSHKLSLGLGAVLALSFGCNGERSESVSSKSQNIIYGVDDRLNVVNHPDPRAEQWSRSIGLLGASDTLCPEPSDETCSPLLSSLVLGGDVDPQFGVLCDDQRFHDEMRPATQPCTAFYVGNNRFVTASHCIAPSDCGDPITGKGVLFDFKTDAAGNTPTDIPAASNFYRCERIIDSELQNFDPGRIDWAVFETSTPVEGRTPLRLRRSANLSAGPPASSVPATPLGIVGHGMGLPIKASLNGQPRVVNTNTFYHTIDGFPGDSGSPIINLIDGVVEGIHVAGPVPEPGAGGYAQPSFTERNAGTPERCLEYTTCNEDFCPANENLRQWSVGVPTTRPRLLAAVDEPVIPEEHVMVVLDQSGSMTIIDSDTGKMIWDEAIDAANEWINRDADDPMTRGYSVWTFRRTASGDGGLEKVWPLEGDTVCPDIDAESGDCLLTAEQDYWDLEALMHDEIRENHRPFAGPSTPLAESLCDALERLRRFGTHRRIIFQSDGGENSSDIMHECHGTESQPFESWIDATSLTTDWGMSADSWQLKVVRRAVHLAQPIASAVATALLPTSLFPVSLDWHVDVHFNRTFPTFAPAAFAFTRVMPSTPEWQDRSTASVSPFAPVAFALAAVAPVDSISAAELSFFRGLGGATPGSTYREFVRTDEMVIYGVDHAIDADTDDSGCVDQADLSIVTQSGVWMRRAVQPNQLAIRADLSRDGWVNYSDLQMILDQWGEGCSNLPHAPDLGGRPIPGMPTCDDGLKNGGETAVDCGGRCSACADGNACVQNSDCSSGYCDLGSCGPAPMFDACECQPNKCDDCSSQIAACDSTPGCRAILHCTSVYACSFPHEQCVAGESCHAITGYDQSSTAGQAANHVISCMGGC